MIYDAQERLAFYFPGNLGRQMMAFLSGMSLSVLDGDHPIGESGVVARVMGYPTRPVEENRLEAHRRYVDVQCGLQGREMLWRYPKEALRLCEGYDASKDVEFFELPDRMPVSLQLDADSFAVFFPQDAHMGQLPVGGPGKPVRKVVFKVPVDLYPDTGVFAAPADPHSIKELDGGCR